MSFEYKDKFICPKSKKETHSFVEYFNDCILNESPNNIGIYFKDIFDMYLPNLEYTEKEIIKLPKIDTFNFFDKTLDIYLESFKDGENRYYFVDPTHIVNRHLLVSYFFANPTNYGVFAIGIWNKSTYRGLFKYTFFNYFLPKFKTIISCFSQTQLGENFWKSVIEIGLKENNKYEVGIFYNEKKEFQKLNKFEEFDMNNVWREANKRVYIKQLG